MKITRTDDHVHVVIQQIGGAITKVRATAQKWVAADYHAAFMEEESPYGETRAEIWTLPLMKASEESGDGHSGD